MVMRPTLARAAGGGFIGTLVMTAIMYFVAPMMGLHMEATHTSDEDCSVYLDSSRRRVKQDLVELAQGSGDHLAGVPLELRRGSVEEVLPEFEVAEGVDLVVMGTMGRTGVARHLWGNTVERLVDRLLCSVVSVKPATEVSSVRADASA